jgi:hypothetical protein
VTTPDNLIALPRADRMIATPLIIEGRRSRFTTIRVPPDSKVPFDPGNLRIFLNACPDHLRDMLVAPGFPMENKVVPRDPNIPKRDPFK